MATLNDTSESRTPSFSSAIVVTVPCESYLPWVERKEAKLEDLQSLLVVNLIFLYFFLSGCDSFMAH